MSYVIRSTSVRPIFSCLCSVLEINACHYVLFLLAIVLSVNLLVTTSDYPFDYPFGIFKPFILYLQLHSLHVFSLNKLQDINTKQLFTLVCKFYKVCSKTIMNNSEQKVSVFVTLL